MISDYCVEVKEAKQWIRKKKGELPVFREMRDTDAQIEHELHLIDAMNCAMNESVARAMEDDDDEHDES